MKALITDKCKVWDITDKGTYTEATLKTSRPVKENDTYDQSRVERGIAKNGFVPESHTFVKFVKNAHDKIKEVKPGTTLTNLRATFSKEAYWSTADNCIMYPKNEKLTIFAFEIDGEESTKTTTTNLDKAPQVAEEPAKQTVAPVDNTPTETPVDAEDECPF